MSLQHSPHTTGASTPLPTLTVTYLYPPSDTSNMPVEGVSIPRKRKQRVDIACDFCRRRKVPSSASLPTILDHRIDSPRKSWAVTMECQNVKIALSIRANAPSRHRIGNQQAAWQRSGSVNRQVLVTASLTQPRIHLPNCRLDHG